MHIQHIVDNIKDMAERFSDFASCESLSDEAETDRQTDGNGFQLKSRKKKTKKHKLSPSPTKEFFLKKPNIRKSPASQVQSSPVDLVKKNLQKLS